MRAQLEQARRLLHTASIRLAHWLSIEDDPRKQIIEFLEASAEPGAPVEIGERAEFEREERYVVIKISKMHSHPVFRAKHLSALRREHGGAMVDCVVVERDWPEYEPTWAAIEARAALDRKA